MKASLDHSDMLKHSCKMMLKSAWRSPGEQLEQNVGPEHRQKLWLKANNEPVQISFKTRVQTLDHKDQHKLNKCVYKKTKHT